MITVRGTLTLVIAPVFEVFLIVLDGVQGPGGDWGGGIPRAQPHS